MSTFNCISAVNIGSPVPAAIGGMGIGDTLSGSSSFTPTSLGSNAWWKISANAAAPASVAAEPTTIIKTGVIALVGGATTWGGGGANGYGIGPGTINSGTWTVTLDFTEGTGDVTTQVIGFRAYQVNANLNSSTLIPGIGNANGWKYGSSITATTTGYVITVTGVPAVTFASTTPYLYIELVVNTTAQTTGVTACTLTNISVAVPSISYQRTQTETLTPSDSNARAWQGSRAQTETVGAATDTVARVYNAIRAQVETVSSSDSNSRAWHGARTNVETQPTTDSNSRAWQGARTQTENQPTTDSTGRTVSFHRQQTENLTAGGGTIVKKIFNINE